MILYIEKRLFTNGRERLLFFIYIINIYSIFFYSNSMSILVPVLPNYSLALIANMLLVPAAFMVRHELKFLTSILILCMITLVVDVFLQRDLPINIIRGLLVVYVLSMIGSELVSEGKLKAIVKYGTLLAVTLFLLQFFSVYFYGLVFFGIEYPTYIYPRSIVSFRYSPLNGDPNYFAYSIMPFVIISTYYYFFRGKGERLSAVYPFLGFAVIFFTMSRGALMALFVTTFFLWFAKRLKNGFSLSNFFSILIAVVCLTSVFYYLNSAREGNIASSSSQRVEILYKQYELIKHNFIIGHGLDGTKVVIGDNILGPHNLFLEILNAYGVVALLVIVLPVLTVIWSEKGVGRYLGIGFILASSFLGLLIYHPMWVFYHFMFVKERSDK